MYIYIYILCMCIYIYINYNLINIYIYEYIDTSKKMQSNIKFWHVAGKWTFSIFWRGYYTLIHSNPMILSQQRWMRCKPLSNWDFKYCLLLGNYNIETENPWFLSRGLSLLSAFPKQCAMAPVSADALLRVVSRHDLGHQVSCHQLSRVPEDSSLEPLDFGEKGTVERK